jgi:hypothetical protein
MTPKPAYTALVDLINKKWWTETDKKSSMQGVCDFRGFYGDYNITVTPRSGATKTFKLKLSKDGQRDFKFVLD